MFRYIEVMSSGLGHGLLSITGAMSSGHGHIIIINTGPCPGISLWHVQLIWGHGLWTWLYHDSYFHVQEHWPWPWIQAKHQVHGLVTWWIMNSHCMAKVKYHEPRYYVNFPALFRPYDQQSSAKARSRGKVPITLNVVFHYWLRNFWNSVIKLLSCMYWM